MNGLAVRPESLKSRPFIPPVIPVEYSQRPANSAMLRPHVAHVSHGRDGDARNHPRSIACPQLAAFEGRPKLRRRAALPPRRLPMRRSNRAVHNLAPMLAAHDERAAAHGRAVRPEQRTRRRRIHGLDQRQRVRLLPCDPPQIDEHASTGRTLVLPQPPRNQQRLCNGGVV